MMRFCVVALYLCLPALPAWAGINDVLDHCIAPNITLSDRANKLQTSGWNNTASQNHSIKALRDALILANLPATASADHVIEQQAWATDLAEALRNSAGMENVFVLEKSDATVFVEARTDDLHTCMYVGQGGTLAPISALTGHAIPPVTEGRSILRSSLPGGRVSAFLWQRDALNSLKVDTTYDFTFTIVLDRRDAGSFGE